MIALIIALSIVMILLAVIFILIEIFYKKFYYKRGDGAVCIKYQFFSDFPNLKRRKISFKSKKNILRGFIYNDKDIHEYKALVVICHGIGYGHYYLFPWINYLCKNGYLVLGYDATASNLSEGKRISSMLQAIYDLNEALKFVENNKEFDKYRLYLFGHSMGGCASLNVLHYHHPRLEKVLTVAGFNNEAEEATAFNKAYTLLKPFLYIRNFFHYGRLAFFTGKSALKKTHAKVYYIQGENDVVVPLSVGYNKFKNIRNPNVKCELIPNKGHTPFVSDKAQEEQGKLLFNLGLLGGVLTPPTYVLNYKAISEPDEKIYQKMINFFND